MIQYIYIVKCPNCEDEHFDFFDDAKSFALGCLGSKPIINQIEVCRNDFGECTDSSDLGNIWSWEDEIQLTDEPVALTKDCLGEYDPDNDPEFQDDDFFALNNTEESLVTEDFDFNKAAAQCSRKCYDFYKALASKAPQKEINKLGKPAYKFVKDQFGLVDDDAEDLLWRGYIIWKQLHEKASKPGDRKPVPADMTIEQLVEAMEENEDTVECVCCQELYPKEDCKYDEKHGWLCPDCQDEVVECTWCEELYDRSQCRYEVDLGWLCDHCEAAIKSRGETLTFREGSYWDFLDEETDLKEANLKDIADAANYEYGTNYDERELLRHAGVDDDEFWNSYADFTSQFYKDPVTKNRMLGRASAKRAQERRAAAKPDISARPDKENF